MTQTEHKRERHTSRSVAGTLAFVAIALLAILLANSVVSRVLSGARAYVTGEGLWSKAQKDGVFHLLTYEETHDEREYSKFLAELEVPLGDRRAREELESPHPRLDAVRRGFLDGRNHPDDVDSLVWMFRRFHGIGYFRSAVAIWTDGDAQIDRLRDLGAELHGRVQAGRTDETEMLALRRRIEAVNERLTILEDAFSLTLGEGARWARDILFDAIAVLAALLMAAAAVISTRAARALRREDEELRDSEERYRTLAEAATDAILSIDENGTILYANRAAEKIFGHAVERMTGQPIATLVPDALRAPREAGNALSETTGGDVRNQEAVEMIGLHASGKEIPIELSFGRVATGRRTTYTGIIRDVSDRKAAERVQAALYRITELTTEASDLPSFYAALHGIVGQLMAAKNFYIAIADESDGTIHFPYFVDEVDPPPPPLSSGQGLTGHIIRTGQPLLLTEKEIEAMATEGRVEAYGAKTVDWLGVPLRSGGRTFGVLTVQSYNERVRYGEAEKDLLTFVSQHIAGAIEKKRAAEEARRAEKEIERLAYQDALTGLANRFRLEDRLRLALGSARRDRHLLAVLFIDLDHFKLVNDSLGHKVGDLLLREVAERILRQVRGTDTLARLGGDEFILLLGKIDSVAGAEFVARKIQRSLRSPCMVADRELFVTLSIGISIFPQDGDDGDTLVRNADAAMYVAKERGRDTYQLHSRSEERGSIERLDLASKLHRAIEQSEFRVHFQPLVRLSDGEISGMEALVRWQHPEKGLLLPDHFIPLAEQSGVIFALGALVLREACMRTRQWRDAWDRNLSISVNLSVRQLERSGFPDSVRAVLAETGLPASALHLEITESIAMENFTACLAALRDLHALGIGITMDDFGTGYSSLSYLKKLPVDTLKIDRSFVRDLATDPNDASIVRAAIVMAHELRLRVVAEGVETAEQLQFLRQHRCDELQGFLFSPAVVPGDFEDILAARKRLSD